MRTARAEDRSLLEVSSGVGLAFLTSARNVGREHLVTPYQQDWAPLRREGFGAHAARIGRPYYQAVTAHWSPERVTITERLPQCASRGASQARGWAARSVLLRRMTSRSADHGPS